MTTQEKVDEMIRLHEMAFSYEKGGIIADFSNMELQDIDFHESDLRFANFSGCNLVGANFNNCNLTQANFDSADLSDALFIGAELKYAILSYAECKRTDFRCADLEGAMVYRATFTDANMDFCSLKYAGITGAHFEDAINMPYIPLACPDTGSFTGWKKAFNPVEEERVIVKLTIPEDAMRASAGGNKCRASKAIVEDIVNCYDEDVHYTIAVSCFDKDFVYEVGKVVEPITPFEENRWKECASGIHFFINKQDAVDYRI